LKVLSFCSRNLELKTIDDIHVELVNDNRSKSAKQLDPILENVENDLRKDGSIRLHLKFNNGTGKKPLNLKMRAKITYKENPMFPPLVQPNVKSEKSGNFLSNNESDISKPFIVTTNSNQWKDSGEILLKMLAFGDKLQIPVAQFANALQEFFICATGQELSHPVRPLSPSDLHFIMTLKFGNKVVLTSSEYDSLWSWFGPGFTLLTHKRHLLPMWKKGLLHGFISKEEAETILSIEGDKTFLLRFSNNHPGKICISYKNQDDKIRHYLIKDSDTAGNVKTIVHFLLEVDKISTILQLTDDTDQFGNPKFRRVSKDEAFMSFFSVRRKKKEETDADDEDFNRYDESILD